MHKQGSIGGGAGGSSNNAADDGTTEKMVGSLEYFSKILMILTRLQVLQVFRLMPH